jgi:hypothetical protein
VSFFQVDAEAPYDLVVIAEVYSDIAEGAYTTNDGIVPPQKIYMVFANGYPKCDLDPPCFCGVQSFETYTAVGNTELNLTSDASSIKASEGNLYNLINILYAAVRLDLGHWTADNVSVTFSSKMLAQLFPRDIYQHYIVQERHSAIHSHSEHACRK